MKIAGLGNDERAEAWMWFWGRLGLDNSKQVTSKIQQKNTGSSLHHLKMKH
jgi:hypothetical protein